MDYKIETTKFLEVKLNEFEHDVLRALFRKYATYKLHVLPDDEDTQKLVSDMCVELDGSDTIYLNEDYIPETMAFMDFIIINFYYDFGHDEFEVIRNFNSTIQDFALNVNKVGDGG